MSNPFTNPATVQVAQELLSPRARRWIYLGLAFGAFCLGAVGQWYDAMDRVAPEWLDGVEAVAYYFLVPFGVIAAVNVPSTPPVVATTEVADYDDYDDDIPGETDGHVAEVPPAPVA